MSARQSNRNAELARIHCLKRDLALADDEYRDMLFTIGRVRSAGDLDYGGRGQVIEHLSSLARRLSGAAKPTVSRGAKPAVPAERQAQVSKIEALLADAERPWNYAEAIAKRVCKVDAIRFCTPAQLGKIIAALSYDAKRRAAKDAA